MADYTLPRDVEKRLRYFDGQFLKDQDFIDEQHYFLDRQRRHSRFLNVAGIVDGLEVTPDAAQVTVAPGTALDSQGRQIVLGHDRSVPLAAYKGKTVHLVIAYQQKESDQAQVEAGGAGATRFWEDPYLDPDDKLPPGITTADRIILARLTIDANGTITRDDTVRVYAGVRLPDGTGTGQGPTLRAGTPSRLDLTGALSVTGNVGIGETNPKAHLDVAGDIQANTVSLARDNNKRGALFLALRNDFNHALYNNNSNIDSEGAWDGAKWNVGAGLHIRVGSSKSSALYIASGGNVGIGTIAPGTFKLKVEGGATSLGGTLTVTNTTTLQDTLTVTKATTLQDTLTVTKATTLQDTLTVTKATTLQDTLSVTKTVTITATTQAAETNIKQDAKYSGLNIRATYVANNYVPGIVWTNNDNNAERPKAGIWMSTHPTGSRLYLGTSSDYPKGITNTAMTVHESGSVGIGTPTPGAKLDVRGSIKLGEDGELFATAGVDNLRILCGTVNSGGSNATSTNGFSVTKPGTGLYDIKFRTPFANTPAVVVTQQWGAGSADDRLDDFNKVGGDTRDNCTVVAVDPSGVRVKCGRNTGEAEDRQFAFIAIGLR
jgi:hypothetical protein